MNPIRPPAEGLDRCPRCSGDFHCGARDARCDCFDIQITQVLRERIQREFVGCLCMSCLRELAQAEPLNSKSEPVP